MWSEGENRILSVFLENNQRILRADDYENLAQQINVKEGKIRSAAGVKKKLLEIKRQNQAGEQQARPVAQTWTNDEAERLVSSFLNAEGATKTAKIASIVHRFPGRSSKALAKKLRDDFPNIYYEREEVHQIDRPSQSQNHDQLPHQQQSIPSNNESDGEEDNTHIEISDRLRRKFRSIFSKELKNQNKRKIKPFKSRSEALRGGTPWTAFFLS